MALPLTTKKPAETGGGPLYSEKRDMEHTMHSIIHRKLKFVSNRAYLGQDLEGTKKFWKEFVG